MKLIIILLPFFLNTTLATGQVSLTQLLPRKGNNEVGFNHYLAIDSTRTYKRIFDWNNKIIPRQIPVSIWYPSVKTLSEESSPMKVLDYMEILKEEEEWEYLPNEQILNWFYYQNTPENQANLAISSMAYFHSNPIKKKYPAIIYAPSYQGSSIENFALCEFLASHGYIVISSPSRGTENRFLEGGTEKDLETQVRDIEFLIQEVSKRDNVDMSKIGTMGFSFGGLSNVLAQMRNSNIKAIISLDGSIKYQYSTLKKSPFAAIEKVNVPFIHMAQKNIPKNVMVEDKLDTTLNSNFEFYDNLVNSRAYSLKFNNLTHPYFSSLGVLFQDRDMRQDKDDSEIMESYRWMALYTLNFADAFLKNDATSRTFLDGAPEENGIPTGLVTKNAKLPKKKEEFSFEDFNEIAAKKNYRNIEELYDQIRKINPSFILEEGKLNNLGLQLAFNPKTTQYGIDILTLATKVYPESSNLFDSLAEAFLFVGNKKMAIINFKKSLLLSPENQNAKVKLKELNMQSLDKTNRKP